MKDEYISLNKNDKVFFVAEFNDYTDEYVRLTYNLTYEDCKSYVGNKNKSSDFVIYAEIDFNKY